MIYSKDKAVKVLAEVLESCCDVKGFVLACFSRTAITQGSFGVHEVMGRNVVDALVRQQIEIEKLKEELAAYKNASDPMGGGLRSLEWRFVWHGSGGKADSGMGVLRRGGRIVEVPTNGRELLYVGENKNDLEDAELLIAKHNADLLFVAQSKQAQIDRLKQALTGMVNHESAANAREGLEPSMELQFAQEVLGLESLQ